MLARTALILALVCGTVFGQADRGTLTGKVEDPQGAVIAEAKIALRNAETGALHETVSTATGNYSLLQVPAGTYDLSVEFSGFKCSGSSSNETA